MEGAQSHGLIAIELSMKSFRAWSAKNGGAKTARKLLKINTPGRTRTCDPLLRRQQQLNIGEPQWTNYPFFIGFFALLCL